MKFKTAFKPIPGTLEVIGAIHSDIVSSFWIGEYNWEEDLVIIPINIDKEQDSLYYPTIKPAYYNRTQFYNIYKYVNSVLKFRLPVKNKYGFRLVLISNRKFKHATKYSLFEFEKGFYPAYSRGENFPTLCRKGIKHAAIACGLSEEKAKKLISNRCLYIEVL